MAVCRSVDEGVGSLSGRGDRSARPRPLRKGANGISAGEPDALGENNAVEIRGSQPHPRGRARPSSPGARHDSPADRGLSGPSLTRQCHFERKSAGSRFKLPGHTTPADTSSFGSPAAAPSCRRQNIHHCPSKLALNCSNGRLSGSHLPYGQEYSIIERKNIAKNRPLTVQTTISTLVSCLLRVLHPLQVLRPLPASQLLPASRLLSWQ